MGDYKPDTLSSIIAETTDNYLSGLSPQSHPQPRDIEKELLRNIHDRIEMYNAVAIKDRKIPMPKHLPNVVIARILQKLYTIKLLKFEGESKELVLYHENGEKEGLYVIDDDEIKKLAEQFNETATEKDLDEIIEKLKRRVDVCTLTKDPDLVAVNNGIFDYKSKTLLPFSPEMVFVSKTRVNYNPFARNINIHNNEDGTDWDVDSWMGSVTDDKEVENLLWQIIGAVIRPNVPWNKSAWLYSMKGNNGKGTLCRLMINICGDESCASIPISNFNDDAYLEKLVKISAVINDENDVGSYIDRAARFKAAVTGDAITINRKYRSAIQFRFRGFIVQCINELPRVKDKSASFRRRLIIIPMMKQFTDCERTYIKEVYMKRTEVLEYVLYKVLNMDYYKLDEPVACKNAMAEYVVYNDPMQAFWNEFHNQFTWDLLPYEFLYDLYKSWFQQFHPAGTTIYHDKFIIELKQIVESDPDWMVLGSARNPGKKLSTPEPLIAEYNLTKWMNHNYTSGRNIYLLSVPSQLKSTYRGLQRKSIAKSSGNNGGNDND